MVKLLQNHYRKCYILLLLLTKKERKKWILIYFLFSKLNRLDQTMWAGTVVASGTAVGCVVYTGSDSRCVMNTSIGSTKVGLLDLELNRLSKVLFGVLIILSASMTLSKVSFFKNENIIFLKIIREYMVNGIYHSFDSCYFFRRWFQSVCESISIWLVNKKNI